MTRSGPFVVFTLCSLPFQAAAQLQLARTGQSTCFATHEAGGVPSGEPVPCPSTGQDGELQRGLAWPVPRFEVTYCDGDGPCSNPGADCDQEPRNDVVVDRLTGLGWPRWGAGSGELAWPAALSWANELTLCGTTDWHLPNFLELESLVNSGVADSTVWLEQAGFFEIASSYWTSSSVVEPRHRDKAWWVELDDGTTYTTPKDSAMHPSWAVRQALHDPVARLWRTGQSVCFDVAGAEIPCAATGQDGDILAGAVWPSPRFIDNSDGTVTDALTGLSWLKWPACLRKINGGAFHWEEALAAVHGMNDGTVPECAYGYTDWRVPNRRELLSLVDFGRYAPAIPEDTPFASTPTVAPFAYWTSTSSGYVVDAPNAPYAWYVSFYDGMLDNNLKNWPIFVWPVRGGSSPPPQDGGLPPDAPEGGDQGLRLDASTLADAAIDGGDEGRCDCHTAGQRSHGPLELMLLFALSAVARANVPRLRG